MDARESVGQINAPSSVFMRSATAAGGRSLALGTLPVWRRDNDHGTFALRITARGLAAIGIEKPGAPSEEAVTSRATSYVRRWKRTGWLGRVDSNLCISESEFAKTLSPGGRDSNLCISKSSKRRIWTVSWSPQAVQRPYCIIRDAVVRLLPPQPASPSPTRHTGLSPASYPF
jgi:hypothetical protein